MSAKKIVEQTFEISLDELLELVRSRYDIPTTARVTFDTDRNLDIARRGRDGVLEIRWGSSELVHPAPKPG
jgi:hypothetical protein